MNEIALSSQVATMDSREIARLTNKNHGHVCRDIKEMLSRLSGTDQSSFGSVYIAGNGEQRNCYKLPYRETMILISGYSVELRARVVDRWLELERKARLPALPDFSDPVAAARAWADECEAKQEAVRALGIAAPKIEAFNRFLDASGSICISDVAKQLGHQPMKFFDELEDAGMIFRRGGDWLPVQRYLDKDYFEVKARTYGEPPHEHITKQTRVTSVGLDALARLFPREATAS
jgi:phage antirepressor YoqD-like protein